MARPAVEEPPSYAHSLRPYHDMLVEEIISGLGELRRPAIGLLISGLSAGLDIGFGVLLMSAIATEFGERVDPALERLILANLYAVGFIFVVLGRSELFTEHTSLAVFPVLAGRATVAALARLWSLLYVANIAGALLFAAMLAFIGPRLGFATPDAFKRIATPLTAHAWWLLLLSGVVAGWLMGLLAWLVSATRDTLSQIVFVWLVTASIGIARLGHSIAGAVEVGAAMFALKQFDPLTLGGFLLWTTIGNALGGACFVALLKYGHAVHGAPADEAAEEVLSGEAAAEHERELEVRYEIEEAHERGKLP